MPEPTSAKLRRVASSAQHTRRLVAFARCLHRPLPALLCKRLRIARLMIPIVIGLSNPSSDVLVASTPTDYAYPQFDFVTKQPMYVFLIALRTP